MNLYLILGKISPYTNMKRLTIDHGLLSSHMKKSKQAKNFIQRPSYPGGRAAINELIKKEIRYPKKALEAKIEGKVRVAYSLNHKGEVIRAKVEKGLGHGCDEEAVRLVHLLRFEVPKNRGMKVTFNKTITINFKLPKQKTPKPEIKKTAIQYQYTTSKSSTVKKNTNKNSYQITIKIRS